MHKHHTTRLRASQQKIQWTYRTDLSRSTRDVAEALDTAPSMYVECWRSAEWIAKQVGLSVGTVLKALKELELKGLISRVVDYALKTRRRIVLTWRQTEPEPEPVEEAVNHAVESYVPPAVVEPEAAASHPGEPGAPDAPPSQEALDDLVKRAARLGSPSRRWVTDVATKYGFRDVSRAVDHAVARGKRRFGWVLSAVEAWREQGAPLYIEQTPADVDRRISKWDEQAEQIRRIFGPGGICPFRPELVPVVDDDPTKPWEYWKDADYERRLG